MTEQILDDRPVVSDFVARVRALMADLDADERQELTAGLEADLGELLAEQGPEALGDPADYARELRVAAGHPPTMERRTRAWGLRSAAMDSLDAAHAHWDRLLDSLPAGGPRAFLTTVQPAWWVVRAWVAWMVAQDAWGTTLAATDPAWLGVLAVFVVVSVQLGRRAWRLDRVLTGSVLARLLLIALNILAVACLPGAADRAMNGIAEERGWMYTYDQAVPVETPSNAVVYRDKQACRIQVFDSHGDRVVGGYVWDATWQRELPTDVLC